MCGVRRKFSLSTYHICSSRGESAQHQNCYISSSSTGFVVWESLHYKECHICSARRKNVLYQEGCVCSTKRVWLCGVRRKCKL